MKSKTTVLTSALAAVILLPGAAAAESGFYVGGGIGSAAVDANLDVQLPSLPDFDESDTGYKLFAGYNWQLSNFALGIEGGYSNFGKPSANIEGIGLQVEPTGVNLWGIAALGLGPVDLYGKAGYLMWDADAVVDGSVSTDDGSDAVVDGSVSTDDGSDPGFGVGLRFNAGKLQLRGEYEVFDIDGADLSMLSVGLAYRF